VAAGVSIKALRYYEAVGLVRPGRRTNGYRVYSEEDVRAAAELRQLMALGLTTQEAEPFLECLRAGHDAVDDCPESIAAYQHKIDQLDEAETAELAATTKQAVHALGTATRPQGYNIGMNQGAIAGAGIAAHLHQHVVPRWGGDTNFMPVVGHTRVLPQLLADTRKLLADAWPS
jgi:DNA-binding transcriptional MerR regulator